MRTIYFASPGCQLQADAVRDQAVLLSFGCWKKNRPLLKWAPSYSRVLVDSGSYSEVKSKVRIDHDEYIEWAQERLAWADNWAALDDITGDTERTLRNSERFGFPCLHQTDDIIELPSFIELARKRRGWLGLGFAYPRPSRAECEAWLDSTCEALPADLHVHGFGMESYSNNRLDSTDSTTWWRVAMRIRKALPFLTYGETLALVIKSIQRQPRMTFADDEQLPLLKRIEH